MPIDKIDGDVLRVLERETRLGGRLTASQIAARIGAHPNSVTKVCCGRLSKRVLRQRDESVYVGQDCRSEPNHNRTGGPLVFYYSMRKRNG